MAVATKCPSCGRKVPLPAGFAGGTATCPQPDCAQVFQVQAEAPKMSAVAPTGRKPSAPRPKGSRPELLDRLPTSFFGSPAVYAIGLAVALLYGMVLFGVVSARRHRRETEASVASVELPAAVVGFR